MHKIAKKNNKHGFTLLEIVIVIAIIVMLASVLFINAIDIYNRSHNRANQVTASAQVVRTGIDASESKLANDYHF